MSKEEKIKRHWIVKENNQSTVKYLTWDEKDKLKLRTKFFFETEEAAEHYLNYLNTRKMEE